MKALNPKGWPTDISSCKQCFWRKTMFRLNPIRIKGRCSYAKRWLTDSETIPKWCPIKLP